MKERMERISPERMAGLASFLTGLATHMFGLLNVLHNYDDIAQQPRGFGTGVTSGRWFLQLLGDLAAWLRIDYNLPLVNGVLFLLLVAFSTGFLVSALGIRSRKHAALIGTLFAVFPSAFSTLVFRYTAVYYGIALLLSVMAVWVLPKKKYGLLLSAMCTSLSLGIYQAYVPVTIGIFVLLLLRQALEEDWSLQKLVRQGLWDCLALLLGLFLYFVFLKLTLKGYATQLSDYQGVNEMGNLSIRQLPQLIREAVYSVLMLPLQDYCGINAMMVIKAIYLLIGCVSVVFLLFLLNRKRKAHITFFALALCALFPVAVNFIVIMCPNTWIYTIMVYAFALVPCFPILLQDCQTPPPHRHLSFPRIHLSGRFWKKITCLIVSALICAYAYQTNVQYMALYYANRQMENYTNALVTQVRMTSGFTTDLKWAMIGDIQDPLLHSYWQYEMSYGGIEFTQWMLQRYSWNNWLQNYQGYTPEEADDETIQELAHTSEVRNMPCWPNEGSIKVIGDMVVIKFQELSAE